MAEKTTRTASKYALKRRSGRQMYGPGCCGHKKPARHMQDEVEELRATQPRPSGRVVEWEGLE